MEIIKEFSTDNLKEIRKSLSDSLAQTSSKYNVDIKIGNINYMDTSFSVKLDVSLVVDGNIQSKESKAFENAAESGGCEFPLYWNFVDGYDNCKVIGLNTRSSKYPIIVKNLTKNSNSRYNIDYLNKKYRIANGK